MKKALDELYALMYSAKARIDRLNKDLNYPVTNDECGIKRLAKLRGQKEENEFFIQQLNESIEALLKNN
jgi:hypothetical protein